MAFASHLRTARRSLVKHPLFSGVVILSLGLAIGANSAIFSVIDAALLRPLDVREPERLVNIYTTDSTGRGYGSTSYPDYTYIRDHARDLDGVIGYSGLMTTITGGRPEVVFGELVTGNYFSVTGARISVGRAFTPDEDRDPGAHPVVVVSDRLWKRHFASDPSIVGRPITLNGHPFTVVGIAAPEFTGLLFRGITTELWAPSMMMAQLRTDQLANRDERWMFVKGRLAPNATIQRVMGSLGIAGASLARDFPSSNYGRTFTARRTVDVMINPDGDRVVFPATLILLAGVGLVVLIAATNVANLMFARAASRQREIAVRLALGASRQQLVGQLLMETSLLAVLGGALGLALAFLFAKLLVTFHPPIPIPISLDVGVDGRVVAFTVAVTGLAAVIAGLLPALQASRPSLTSSLTGASIAFTRRSSLMRLRRAFLVPQMTLSLVLLAVAGLFARSVMKAGAVDPGFDITHTSVVALSLNLDGFDSVRARTFYSDLARRLERGGTAQSLTIADRIPLDLYGNQSTTIRNTNARETDSHVVQAAHVDERYFQTLGVTLVRGRAFTEAEVRERMPVAIVSEAMARRFWHTGNDAIGQSLRENDGPPIQIIGVARDTKVQTLGESPQPLLYRPLDGNHARLLRVIVRSTDNPARVVAALQREVAALDPNLAVFESSTMTSHLGVMLFPYRVAAVVSALLGLFGLLLSSVGLFGVVAFSVARRTREFGIRLALGAEPGTILRMVLAEQTRMIALSLALGVAISLGVSRLLSSVVFGISWSDPVTLLGVIAALGSVALVASYLPAARATRINPSVALREE